MADICREHDWSMDFMHDGLFVGKPFRAFNVIDDFNRDAFTIAIDTSLTSERVMRELDKLIEWRGKPEYHMENSTTPKRPAPSLPHSNRIVIVIGNL